MYKVSDNYLVKYIFVVHSKKLFFLHFSQFKIINEREYVHVNNKIL